MKKLLLPVALGLSLHAAAQDWALFPIGQKTWYGVVGTDQMEVDMCLMDSVRIDGNREVHYAKRRFREALFGPSADALNAQVWDQWQWEGPGPNLYVDSVECRSDTVFFHSTYSTSPFYFLPNAAVGDAWTIVSDYHGNEYDSITLTCTGIGQAEFLGITDSVKTFELEPNSGVQVRLSKAHGLLQFPPLALFLYHPPGVPFQSYEVIGLDRTDETVGYRQPGFLDYFPLAPGDLLLWQYDYTGWITEPSVHEFYLDSITSTSIHPDSVTYRFDRVMRHTDHSITYHPQLAQTFRRAAWRRMLEASPNDWCFPPFVEGPDLNLGFVWRSNWIKLKVNPVSLDTVTEIEPYYSGIDIGEGYRMDTRVGLLEYSHWLNPTTTSLQLTAYRVGGVAVGDPDLHLGLQEAAQPGWSIYPNPVRDRLFISVAHGLSIAPYIITDALGREVQRGQLDAGGISVAGLPKGLYLLRAQMGGQAMTARFVKE